MIADHYADLSLERRAAGERVVTFFCLPTSTLPRPTIRVMATVMGTAGKHRPAGYFIVGMMKLAPALAPRGQRAVTVFKRVKKRTPSGPCMKWSPNIEAFQPPKL